MPVLWTLESKKTLISSADLTWESTLTSWNASWRTQRNMKDSLVFWSRHGIHHLSTFIMLQHTSSGSAVLQASNTPFWSLSTIGKVSPKHLSSVIKCAGNCPRHGRLSVTTNDQTTRASCHVWSIFLSSFCIILSLWAESGFLALSVSLVRFELSQNLAPQRVLLQHVLGVQVRVLIGVHAALFLLYKLLPCYANRVRRLLIAILLW